MTTTASPPGARPVAGATGGGRRRGPQERGDSRFLWLLLGPSVAVVALLFAYPIGYAGWLSLLDWNDKISPEHPFVGADNYVRLAQDAEFRAALERTLYFSALTVLVGVALAVGLAVLLTQEFRGRTLARVLLLVPWAVPPVVNGIMWKLIVDGDVGILNALLRRAGIIDTNIQWLADPTSALQVLVVAEIWKLLPFITLLLMAAMQGIPATLYRAAAVDGAGAWRRFLHVTLPGIRTALMVVLIVQTMWSLKVFDTVFVLTGGSGGPAGGTTTINFFGYLTTFSNLDRGYGAAVAVVVMLLVVVSTCVWLLLLGRPPRSRRRVRTAPAAAGERR